MRKRKECGSSKECRTSIIYLTLTTMESTSSDFVLRAEISSSWCEDGLQVSEMEEHHQRKQHS